MFVSVDSPLTGMYCRTCYYDLRGQITSRCPECGADFDPQHPETFLLHEPGRASRLLLWLRRHRMFIIIPVMSAWFATVFLVLPHKVSLLPRQPPAGLMSVVNLKGILTTWHIHRAEGRSLHTLDIEYAKGDMRPSFSPWTEASSAERRYHLTHFLAVAPYWVAPTLVGTLLIAPMVTGRARKGAACLGGLCLLILALAAASKPLNDFLFRGSYAFLDDYVLIASALDAAPNNRSTIAAYDRHSFKGEQRRIIGFADGHVEFLWDDRARTHFAANGLQYPISIP